MPKRLVLEGQALKIAKDEVMMLIPAAFSSRSPGRCLPASRVSTSVPTTQPRQWLTRMGQ